MALERLFGSARAAGAGAALEPHRAGAGADLAGDRLSRPVDLRCRRRAQPVSGLLQVNTHVDLIDWKGGRGFVGEDAALAALVQALVRAAHARHGRAGRRPQSSSCDGRGGVGFPKVDVGKNAANMPGLSVRPAHDLFASREASG